MKARLSSRDLGTALWELFFRLTYIAPSADSWSFVCFLAGKLMSLAQPLMLILYNTSYARGSDIAAYFNVMSYFSSLSSFSIFVYVFFGLTQIFALLAVLQLLSLRQGHTNIASNGHDKEWSAGEHPTLLKITHGFMVLCSQVLPHVSIAVLSLSLSGVLSPTKTYPGFKHLTLPLGNATVQFSICAVLSACTAVESVLLGASFVVFCQDRSILGKSVWSANGWYHGLAELAMEGFIQIEFSMDLTVSLGYALRFTASMMCTLVFSMYVRYQHFWVDMAEFFFTVTETAVTGLVLACTLLDKGFEPYASYPVLLLFLSGLFCVIRGWTVWARKISLEPSNEPAAAEQHIRDLLVLASGRSRKSLTTLAGLLAVHAESCQTPGCPCRDLRSHLGLGKADNGQIGLGRSDKVYFIRREVPEELISGSLVRTVRLLVDDFSLHLAKEDELGVLLAEMAFYFFGNLYVALQRVAQIEADKPRLTIRQRTYNLRRVISTGFEKSRREEGPEETLAALEYLKHYHEFLDDVEEATESTIKFWSIVMEEAPSSGRLSELGRALFECKYRSVQTVEKISAAGSHNLEFLIRYGLFMRLVMHDLIMSEQALKKAISLNESFGPTAVSVSAGNLSLFRSDVSVMLIVAQLEHSGAGTVLEMNTAVEQVLGYSRKDLIGTSVLHLMPPPIARLHEGVVLKFFHSMKSHDLDVTRARYVRGKDGAYVLCNGVKKIVPRLEGGALRVALFMIPDRRESYYSSFRRDPIEKRVGSLLCDPVSYTLIGFTKEALSTLMIPEDRMQELVGNATLYDLFPWMTHTELKERAHKKEGRVVAYVPGSQGPGADAVSAPTLLWVRLVTEKVDGEATALVAMVLAEIKKAAQENYSPEVSSEGVFFRDRSLKTSIARVMLPGNNVTKNVGTPNRSGFPEEKKPALYARQGYSDAASVASMASMDSTHKTESAGSYETTRDLQIATITRQTPPTIKRFATGIFGMLVVICLLIFVSMYVSLQEVTSLENSFNLIHAYHVRYKETMILTDTSRVYNLNIMAGNTAMVQGVLIFRLGLLANYNVATRMLLFSQNLDYDVEPVTVMELDNSNLSTIFSHALLLVQRFQYNQC